VAMRETLESKMPDTAPYKLLSSAVGPARRRPASARLPLALLKSAASSAPDPTHGTNPASGETLKRTQLQLIFKAQLP
jgi:hypothetical protein